VQKKAETPVAVTPENLKDFLGKPRFRKRVKGEVSEVGIATGLAWTEAGGEILMTETSLLKGKGNLTLTGSLGDVMQESARAAVSYVRSRAEMYDADPNFHEKFDIHIHVPEGAIPKDGPSAGITMAASLFSAVTKIPVLKDVAMTGEITLRGKVLPVGGIKDKVLAAYRAGIRTVLLSVENDKDLDDLPEEIRGEMEFHLVSTMDEVIKIAMETPRTTPATLDAEGKPVEGGIVAN
jgi:ATP-dependent Lon protease